MLRGTGKVSIDKPNLQELMIASQVLADLRVHDHEAHRIISDAIAKRLTEQRQGIANSISMIGDVLKLDAGQREKLDRMIDLIRRGLEVHLDIEGNDVRQITSQDESSGQLVK